VFWVVQIGGEGAATVWQLVKATILDPASGRAAFWRAPIVIVR
jgi:hypothetical protein